MNRNTITPARIIITVVACYSAAGSYLFDWNKTHIYNPDWPPHAKFHNAQTMLLGTCLGLLALWTLWGEKGEENTRLRLSVLPAGFYWLTQIGSILFPGTALFDPPFASAHRLPEQLIVDLVMLALLLIAYTLERRRIDRLSR